MVLRLSWWADEWHPDRLGYAVENRQSITTAASRQSFWRLTETPVAILPIVSHPDVARRIDRNIGQHLHVAAHISAGRRNGVTRFHTRRAGLGPHAAQMSNRPADEVGYPNLIVAVDRGAPRTPRAAPTVKG